MTNNKSSSARTKNRSKILGIEELKINATKMQFSCTLHLDSFTG